jgi:hypothetical protein
MKVVNEIKVDLLFLNTPKNFAVYKIITKKKKYVKYRQAIDDEHNMAQRKFILEVLP